ncbi:MAG: hypothetical protein ABSG85_16805 [Spirochaetia bacterium]
MNPEGRVDSIERKLGSVKSPATLVQEFLAQAPHITEALRKHPKAFRAAKREIRRVLMGPHAIDRERYGPAWEVVCHLNALLHRELPAAEEDVAAAAYFGTGTTLEDVRKAQMKYIEELKDWEQYFKKWGNPPPVCGYRNLFRLNGPIERLLLAKAKETRR